MEPEQQQVEVPRVRFLLQVKNMTDLYRLYTRWGGAPGYNNGLPTCTPVLENGNFVEFTTMKEVEAYARAHHGNLYFKKFSKD